MKDTVIIGRGFKKYSLDNKEDIKNFCSIHHIDFQK